MLTATDQSTNSLPVSRSVIIKRFGPKGKVAQIKTKYILGFLFEGLA